MLSPLLAAAEAAILRDVNPRVSGAEMFWAAAGLVVLVWMFIWFGIAQIRWLERVTKEVNKGRPPDDQFKALGIGDGPFKQLDMTIAVLHHDPKGFVKILLRGAVVMLLAIAWVIWAEHLSSR